MTSNSNKPTPPTAAAFLAAGSELGRPNLPILKFTKGGAWVVGADNAPVTETRFVADVPGAEHGFTCFVDHKVVDEVMTPVSHGKKVSQNDLRAHGRGGGWSPSASIRLQSLRTGKEFLYKTTSQGGRATIGELLTEYAHRLEAGKGGVPVVELAVSRYEHKLYGTVHTPQFRIMGWQNDADPAATPVTPGGRAPNVGAFSLSEELGDDDIPF
jgi:hypothetical protein